MTALALKRIYEPPDASDGTRILVDRLWPRGIARDKARIDLWLKEVAPSDALRKRFHGKPDDWDAFRAAYFAEWKVQQFRQPCRICSSTCARVRLPCFMRPATSAGTMRSH